MDKTIRTTIILINQYYGLIRRFLRTSGNFNIFLQNESLPTGMTTVTGSTHITVILYAFVIAVDRSFVTVGVTQDAGVDRIVGCDIVTF